MVLRMAQFTVLALLSGAAGFASADDTTDKPPIRSKDLLGVSEPGKCYRTVGLFDGQMTVGLAIDLCGGTTDAAATLTCYIEAFGSEDTGGLGLTRGGAVDLCRAGGSRQDN